MTDTRPLSWPLVVPTLALLLLAAHFYRAAALPLVLACVVLVALQVLRRPWVPRVLQLALLAGAIEWAWTAALLVQQRLALGLPWQRMAIILSVVALATLAAAAVFRHARVKARYG